MVACNRNTVDVWFSNFSPTRPYPFLLMVYTHGPQAFSGKMWTSKKEAERLCAIVIPNQHVSRPFCGLGLGFAIRIPTGWYEAWYNYKQGSSGHRTSHRNPTDLKSWTMPWLVNHIKSDPSPFQLLVSILNLCAKSALLLFIMFLLAKSCSFPWWFFTLSFKTKKAHVLIFPVQILRVTLHASSSPGPWRMELWFEVNRLGRIPSGND